MKWLVLGLIVLIGCGAGWLLFQRRGIRPPTATISGDGATGDIADAAKANAYNTAADAAIQALTNGELERYFNELLSSNTRKDFPTNYTAILQRQANYFAGCGQHRTTDVVFKSDDGYGYEYAELYRVCQDSNGKNKYYVLVIINENSSYKVGTIEFDRQR